MATTDEAARLLRERIREIDHERKQLEQALEALTDGSSPRRRQRQRRHSAQPTTSNKRAPRGERRKQLLTRIRRNPDTGLADHAKAIGISGTQAAAIARQLVDAGQIVKTARGIYQPKP